MNYIVMDLEWNQAGDRKKSIPGLLFEIIEIGAVRVDEQYNIIDEWHGRIHPQFYTQLQHNVREVLGISDDVLAEGVQFEEAFREFMEWCGDDYTYVTWGCADLTELQCNASFYGVDGKFPYPFLYYDLQKLFSIAYDDGKSRSNLKNAITHMGIEEDEEYHSAITDARYTAKVLCAMAREGRLADVLMFKSVDTYRIPSYRRDEIYLNFGTYSKYISKGFSSKEKAARDRIVRSCNCYMCGKPMTRKIKWFSTNSKMHYGLFCCEEHGLIKGRFRIKQAANGQYYVIKIMKQTDEEGAQKIQDRQLKERESRKRKRNATGRNV